MNEDMLRHLQATMGKVEAQMSQNVLNAYGLTAADLLRQVQPTNLQRPVVTPEFTPGTQVDNEYLPAVYRPRNSWEWSIGPIQPDQIVTDVSKLQAELLRRMLVSSEAQVEELTQPSAPEPVPVESYRKRRLLR